MPRWEQGADSVSFTRLLNQSRFAAERISPLGSKIIYSFLQVVFHDKEEEMDPFEKLLCDTLAARGRSERTQETYGWMLRS